ncbi:uncharacterized protein AB675_4470 [Cyphellophora attinorum]|uniref:Uncharacterized protein n=1 Tax=Cyphellophora attinorum TaxID=1664694 RepID=A0A0N1HS83_9EURO|nr:uncharacterized protein AB675_4470 [Phialophora attinorum]KPI38932.1 hypothetical protein AB675_4470 [Phialophora attinorum]
MSKSWPPSPMVEDEVLSLAKEYCSDVSDTQSTDDLAPAESRGAVDQYPLIIDVNEQGISQEPVKKSMAASPQINVTLDTNPHNGQYETRFIHIPSASDNERDPARAPRRLRSKSTIGIAAGEDPRGRPHVSRINTDLGADLQAMATGQRRAPSPYSYGTRTSTLLPSMLDDTSKVSLLSPEAAASLPMPVPGRRARSQRPERVATKPDSSDSDGRRKDFARRRSKSRHDRGSFSKSSGDERSRPDWPKSRSRRSEQSPPRDQRHATYSTPITPPQTPGLTRESPYTSAAEDSDRRRYRDHPRAERRSSKESSYPSATVDRQPPREYDNGFGRKSRRQSMRRPEKPSIDISDPRHNSRPETPVSARTPRSLENDLEQAFKDNQKKAPRKYGQDDGTSPMMSPLNSPPRTPRGERKSKDYLEMTAPVSNMSKQRTRPANDTSGKPMTTLLGAATIGAATLAAKAAPSLSRSSTNSPDTPSTGSQGESSLRDYLTLANWKSPSEPATCALSQPWTRIAIAKCLKDGSTNLGLLQSLTSRPPSVHPCPGRQTEIRKWYHVVDPTNGAPVQGFNVCTSCVRNAELIFPELWKEQIFQRPESKLAQERYCNLYNDSKHFYGIVNQLDILAGYSKKKDLRNKDISKFCEFVRQKARYRECALDAMLATPLWHFMSALPELTICEECYMEVVYPMRDKPIARDVVMTMQRVPIQRPAHYVAGISCQLYSERMRKVFKDAVMRNDLETLKSAALSRYNIEHRLQDQHRRYALEEEQGYNRQAEIERNAALWRQYE